MGCERRVGIKGNNYYVVVGDVNNVDCYEFKSPDVLLKQLLFENLNLSTYKKVNEKKQNNITRCFLSPKSLTTAIQNINVRELFKLIFPTCQTRCQVVLLVTIKRQLISD